MVNEAAKRAEIKRFVDEAFTGKIARMNDARAKRVAELKVSVARRGLVHSGSTVVAEVEIEEQCAAELLHQKADLYIDAYRQSGMSIGTEVLKDIENSRAQILGGRRAAIIGEAQLRAQRTNEPDNSTRLIYQQFGREAEVAMVEIAAKIDFHNLLPKATPSMLPAVNITYHFENSPNSRVTAGNDHSTNVVNEPELFDRLAAEIRSAAIEPAQQQMLDALEQLRTQKTKTDYLAAVSKFITAAASISHVIAPYLPAIVERAESLLRG